MLHASRVREWSRRFASHSVQYYTVTLFTMSDAMKRFMNNPQDIVSEAMEGLMAANTDFVRLVVDQHPSVSNCVLDAALCHDRTELIIAQITIIVCLVDQGAMLQKSCEE